MNQVGRQSQVQRVGAERVVRAGPDHARQNLAAQSVVFANRLRWIPGRKRLLANHGGLPERRLPADSADADRPCVHHGAVVRIVEDPHLGEIDHHPRSGVHREGRTATESGWESPRREARRRLRDWRGEAPQSPSAIAWQCRAACPRARRRRPWCGRPRIRRRSSARFRRARRWSRPAPTGGVRDTTTRPAASRSCRGGAVPMPDAAQEKVLAIHHRWTRNSERHGDPRVPPPSRSPVRSHERKGARWPWVIRAGHGRNPARPDSVTGRGRHGGISNRDSSESAHFTARAIPPRRASAIRSLSVLASAVLASSVSAVTGLAHQLEHEQVRSDTEKKRGKCCDLPRHAAVRAPCREIPHDGQEHDRAASPHPVLHQRVAGFAPLRPLTHCGNPPCCRRVRIQHVDNRTSPEFPSSAPVPARQPTVGRRRVCGRFTSTVPIAPSGCRRASGS